MLREQRRTQSGFIHARNVVGKHVHWIKISDVGHKNEKDSEKFGI
jgi:hypothetical protein